MGLLTNIRRFIRIFRFEGKTIAIRRAFEFSTQRFRSRWGYMINYKKYSTTFIPVISVNRSGSTWMQYLLAEIPGFTYVEPSPIFGREGSQRLEQSDSRLFKNRLSVIKLHCHPEPTIGTIREMGCKCLFMFRDPRDIAVSWIHFAESISNSDWGDFRQLSRKEQLIHYCDNFLSRDVSMIREWMRFRECEDVMFLSYEDLLNDQGGSFESVTEFFGLGLDRELLDRIVAKHSFSKITGRKPGVEDSLNRARKGISGDWRNYFDYDLGRRFESEFHGILSDLGYEEDNRWYEGL